MKFLTYQCRFGGLHRVISYLASQEGERLNSQAKQQVVCLIFMRSRLFLRRKPLFKARAVDARVHLPRTTTSQTAGSRDHTDVVRVVARLSALYLMMSALLRQQQQQQALVATLLIGSTTLWVGRCGEN